MTDPTFQPPKNLGGPTTPPSKMSGGEKSTLGCLAIILAPIALIVIALIIGAIWAGFNGSSNDPNKYEAIRYCEDQIREQLKAPSTAKFDSDSIDSTSPFTVSGSVDAENSFGATIRSDFQCTVTISGDSFRAVVDYLD